MPIDKSLRIFGLAYKAGKARAGTFITEKLIREKKAKLVLIATDGSEKQTEKLLNLCERNKIEHIEICTKDELGKISGRSQVLCAVVTDENFKSGIINNTINGGA